MAFETAFAIDTSSIKYGSGVTREVGFDMRSLGCQRVMVVTDPEMASKESVRITLSSLRKESVDAILFDRVRIEPTDGSLREAINVASEGGFDGFVAVGGGSSIDTAKVANLYSTYPAEFLTYVNAPIGLGRPVPGPLKPLAAIPTTSGTGSETTGVAIFDLEEMQAKTGISHRRLRPTIGLVDPENTKTLPGMVIACSGLDVLCHGLESFTALPFSQRSKPDTPGTRPSYQGSNPISDVWSLKAIEMVSKNIERAVNDLGDYEARSNMLLAATFAGVGFGNAGCHLPHGMSYPVSGMVRGYIPDGYPKGHPIIPHGMSVALNAPAVFRFTAPSDPGRHFEAAKALGSDARWAGLDDAGDVLSTAIISLMKKIHMPNGLKSVGFNNDDVSALVKGTIPQHRVTKLSPREANEDDLRQLFLDSMKLW
jgi:hydroxyacid-oxoacid transhydrogenase